MFGITTDSATKPYILIADDDVDCQMLLQSVVQNCGFEAHVAVNGQMALEMIEGLKPDLVLLDVQMPGMDGFAVSQKMRMDPNLKDIPTIFITAFSDTAFKIEAFKHGCVDFIVKPIDVVDVALRLTTHWNLQRYKRDLVKAAEEQKQMTAEIEDLYNNAPCGYHSTDKHGVIVRINDTALNWFGYSRDEIVGRMRIVDLLAPESRSAFKIEFPLFLKKGSVKDHEATWVRKNGSTFSMLTNATALKNADGELVMSRVTSFDISDRKRLEKEKEGLREKLYYTQNLTSLAELVGGIAHEILNPMAVISGTSTLLQKRLALASPHSSDQKVAEMLAVIQKSSARVSDILHSLRLIAGDGVKDPFGKVTVRSIVQVCIAHCNQHFKSDAVVMIINDPPDVEFECCPDQIQQILINLLNNGFDAAKGLPDTWVKLEVSQADECITFEVSNNGRAIPPEHRQKIFEPFFTTKEVGKGLGLGLCISRCLTLAHQGELFLEESPANTRFVLRLPKNQSVAIQR